MRWSTADKRDKIDPFLTQNLPAWNVKQLVLYATKASVVSERLIPSADVALISFRYLKMVRCISAVG